MIRIGCHLSMAKGFLALARDAVSIGAGTFQFFSSNPRGGRSRAWDTADVLAMKQVLSEHDICRFVVHAPYILNPLSPDPDKRAFALARMQEDLGKIRGWGGMYNFHPGCRMQQGTSEAADILTSHMQTLLEAAGDTPVLMECMAGKGSEFGASFEELGEVVRRTGDGRAGVCLDTCHIWDAGYDIVHDLEGVLDAFDRHIGLERLRAIHLNDSMNPCGSHRDRHAKLGEGRIGFEALLAMTRHPALADVPFILETPNELDGYAREIRWIREGKIC